MHPDLVKILACPACRGDVALQDTDIVCRACGRRYPVRDGVPVMLVEASVRPDGQGTDS